MRGLGDVGCSPGCLDANPRRPSDAAFNLKDDVCKEEGKIAGGEAHSWKRKIPALDAPALLLFSGLPSWGLSFGQGCLYLGGRGGSTAGSPLLPTSPAFGGTVALPRASHAAEGTSPPSVFSLSPQPTHELGLPALQFQDAEHRVPKPASQHIHCGFRHGHLRLHPQFALLLLLDQAQTSSTQRALRLQTGYTQGKGEGAEPTRDLRRLPGGVQAQGRAGDLSLQTCLPQKVPHQVAGGAESLSPLQHAGAAAGAAAQQAGPRPPPGPPPRRPEHRIAPPRPAPPPRALGDNQSTTAPARRGRRGGGGASAAL